MNQKTVGLTSRAAMLALAFIMVASLALLPLDGVAYAQTAAPANLQAVARSDGSAVDVSWGAVADADSYQLYKRVGEGAFNPMSVTGTTYADTAVSAGMTYGYFVRAVVGGATGPWSIYASATAGAPRPAAPANLTVTADSLTAVEISWSAVTGAASYEIYRWDGTAAAGIWIRDLTGTSHSDTNVTSGVTYSYNIRAVNAVGGRGDWSGYQSVKVQGVTSVPQLSLVHDERGVIELEWTAVAAGATYELDRRKSTGGWVSVELDDPSARAHTDNITDAGTYYYRVRAVVDDQEGPWSNEKKTVVPESGRRPGTPTIMTATATGSTTIVVDWDVSLPATATEYILQWKSGTQEWSSSRQREPSAKTYTLEGLRAGVEYTFRVQAVNVNGPSEWSVEKSATTFSSAVTHIEGRLGPPQGVKVVDDSKVVSNGVIDRKLKVTWSRVRDATHYQVFKWLDEDGPNNNTETFDWVSEAYVTTTSHPDDSDTIDNNLTDLDPGMTYHYVVRAVSDSTAAAGATEPTTNAVYGEWSANAMGTTKAYKPAKPILSAEVRGGNAIWLAWTSAMANSGDNADEGGQVGATTGYQLQWRRSGSGASWATFQDLGAGMKNEGNHFHQNLQSNRTYFYKVRGMNNSGYGPWSEVQEKKIPAQTKPATPTGVAVMDASIYDTAAVLTPKLKVSWNKVAGATGYQVQGWAMMTDDEDNKEWMWKSVAGSPTDKTSITVSMLGRDHGATEDRNLVKGTTYYFVVRAVNGGIEGDWSASTYGTTKRTKPSPPILRAVTTGEKMIRLSWHEVTDATSYQLGFIKQVGARAADDRDDEDYTVIPVNGMHFVHSGRTAGTAYDYRIRAVLPAGVYTDWSAMARATTRPARPAKFKAVASATGTPVVHTVTLTWKKVTYDTASTTGSAAGTAGSPVAYQVQVRESGEDTWGNVEGTQDCASTTDTTICTLLHTTDVDDRTRYYYRLRATGVANTPSSNGYWVMTDVTTKSDDGDD